MRSLIRAGNVLVASLAFHLIAAVPVRGDTFTYVLGPTFNGAAPKSTSPFLTAEFKDNGLNSVLLTLTAGLEAATEYIDEITFNLNPLFAPSSVSVSWISSSIEKVNGDNSSPAAAGAQNDQKIDGAAGDGFDFEILLANAAANRFNGTDVITLNLTRALGLSAADFIGYTNTGSANAHVAAHVAGILDGTRTTSGFIKDDPTRDPRGGPLVPEPTSLALLGIGIAGLAGYRLQRKVPLGKSVA